MKKIKVETLIIGAGPAGMAAAMELARTGKEKSEIFGTRKNESF